jgi:hypothetical protein
MLRFVPSGRATAEIAKSVRHAKDYVRIEIIL